MTPLRVVLAFLSLGLDAIATAIGLMYWTSLGKRAGPLFCPGSLSCPEPATTPARWEWAAAYFVYPISLIFFAALFAIALGAKAQRSFIVSLIVHSPLIMLMFLSQGILLSARPHAWWIVRSGLGLAVVAMLAIFTGRRDSPPGRRGLVRIRG